ncbi:MAG: DegV family protein [Clostridiales bacterium]|nr:DegV family protein [Clostridiales bacterium]
MSKFFCDTNCELWYEKAEQLGINVIKMPYTLGNEMYFYDLGKETDCKAFFGAMRNGDSAKTQALNMDEYIEYFEPVFASGEDIVYVTFSQTMSGTFNSMRLAIEALSEKYPERKITVIDSSLISCGAGVVVEEAAKLHNSGASAEDIVNFVEYFKKRVKMYFTVGELKYLVRGGRLSAVAGALGTLLNLKPIIGVDDNGKLASLAKVNGRKKAIHTLVEKLALDIVDTSYPIILVHADSEADNKIMENAVLQKYPDAKIEIQLIGPVIGAHCGPDTLGIIFVSKEN